MPIKLDGGDLSEVQRRAIDPYTDAEKEEFVTVILDHVRAVMHTYSGLVLKEIADKAKATLEAKRFEATWGQEANKK